jgi:uncharacterized membrane protein YwzB
MNGLWFEGYSVMGELSMGDLLSPHHILILIFFAGVAYVFWEIFKKAGHAPKQRLLMTFACTVLVMVVLGLVATIALSLAQRHSISISY